MEDSTLQNNPCIPVPSPQMIKRDLFPSGVLPPVTLPAAWNATAIFTPFGGGSLSSAQPSDQLVVGSITCECPTPNERYMRCRLYLLESLRYFDFLFRTANGVTQWWWLVSNPGEANGIPSAVFGPFSSTAIVPATDFLAANRFTHVGSWKIHELTHDSFSGRHTAKAGTWYLFNSISGGLGRVMNVDNANDFGVAVLGAYYLIEVFSFRTTTVSSLQTLCATCPQAALATAGPSAMRSQADLLTAMAAPPTGASQIPCTIAQIQELIPGISPAPAVILPPSWTDQVSSDCYMIGQDLYPYYCQLWYDWDQGIQITVFVFQDDTGSYTVRQDERLPKGQVGPSVDYSWDGSKWNPSCFTAGGGGVPMPVPGFVKAGGGRCRGVIANNPLFGSASIWTVQLGGPGSSADFWYWFDDKQRGVIFSLAPARSLTIIDYQTFIQNVPIAACVFDDPSGSISACQQDHADSQKRTKRMFVPK
jgi:hypothetical protein